MIEPMNDLHYFRADWITHSDQKLSVDVCVYGASSAGVAAAIEIARRGKTVALLQPGKFVGGLTSGGLGWTDFGKQHVIGGFAREYYRQVGALYGKPEEWYFAPAQAKQVFDLLLSRAGITPMLCQYLDRVEMDGQRIALITLRGGLRVHARFFMDCSYEGDLLARTGATFHVGRETNSAYNETLNGIHVGPFHQFGPATVDPFLTPGDPSSGLLPMIEPVDQHRYVGQGDHRLQAYNFRICMTDDPALRLDWDKPESYRALDHELAVRWFNADKDSHNDQFPAHKGHPDHAFRKCDTMPNKTPGGFLKTDTNNHGPVSSDFIGGNWAWPTSTYERREMIFQQHVDYQKGFYWTMANDPRVPTRYRDSYRRWGLCKDEFQSTGGWSHTLYVREGRRLVGDYVLTEHDCMHKVQCNDAVGMGSYQLDSHNCTRFVNADGKVQNDGDVQVKPAGPYKISYRCIVPKRGQCQNLFVPVCISTSHIAYGSVRMEPVFMILGQSAAVAACIAIDDGLAAQGVPYEKLKPALDELGQVTHVD
jgi:hypothetical protein